MKAALITQAVIAQSNDWDGHHDLGGGWSIVMMIGMVLFWVLVVAAVVWAVRAWTGSQGPARSESSPQDVLARRLAAGEISVEEFEERRGVLSGPAGTAGTTDST